MTKRVYKFLSAQYALDDLDRRRIKVSTIDELNDPFDLTAADTTDPRIEDAINRIIVWFREAKGLLCFSRNWDNILQWSHYAASHTGLCLGFDIPDTDAGYSQEVAYQPGLLVVQSPADVNYEFANRLLRTKHEIWSYEQELRMFVQLNDPRDDNGLRWFDFGESLNLREIIVGVNCSVEDAAKVVEIHERYLDTVELAWASLRKDAFPLLRTPSPPPWLVPEN
jgi:hypothetical protein